MRAIHCKRSSVVPVLILLFVQMAVPGNGIDVADYSYFYQDGEDDVVYFSYLDHGFYKGRQDADIDILHISVIEGKGCLNLSLKVKGAILNGSECLYEIYGDLDEHELIYVDMIISYENGMTELVLSGTDRSFDLMPWTNISTCFLNISIPIHWLPDDEFDSFSAHTSRYDPVDMAVYMDSTEPLDEFATNERPLLFPLIALILFFLVVLAVVYLTIGGKMMKKIKKGMRRRCPECGVIFKWGTKRCIYCQTDLK